MPWKSSAQMRAGYAGALGPEMQRKAPEWSAETPSIRALPKHVAMPTKRTALLKKMKG